MAYSGVDIVTAPASTSEFRLLTQVSPSFDQMIQAMDEAQEFICLEMYIYTASEIGNRFRDALVRAAQRGLRVRALIDALGSLTLTDAFWGPLREAGGEARWFNPLKLARLGIRNHRKLLVCDGKVAFIGGFNVAEEYEGDGVTRGWYDLGLRLTGPLVGELLASFDLLCGLADFQHKRAARWRKSPVRKLASTQDGQLILSGPGRGVHYLKRAWMHDVQRAQNIQIMCAYFLPTRPMRRALIRAARRGARVQLILAGKSDVPLSRLAGCSFYQQFLRAGVEIYEYQPQIFHAKLFLIDEQVYIGSANLDRRSLHINYELMVRLAQPELTEAARKTVERALEHSKQISPSEWKKSRTFWSKLKERWAYFILARVDPYIARRQYDSLGRG